MTACSIGAVPETKHGGARDLHTPAVAYCFTHQCRVSEGECDRARIAQLEAALREVKARTAAYKNDHDNWPLAAGLYDLANGVLTSKK